MITACYPDIWPILVNWATARTGCRATGEDLASAAIERCLRAEMRGQDTGRAYAFIALRCCWLDWYRSSAQRTSLPLGDLDPPDRLPDQLAGVEAERMLAEMPLATATMFRMASAGYHCPEIADALGLTEAAVRKILYRGRVRARAAA